MADEPCMWVDADRSVESGPTSTLRQMVWRDKDGRRVVERVPARCAVPGSTNGTPLRFKRWLPLLRMDGNMVRVPLTNAAAHVDTNTSYAQNQIEKAKRNGGFRFDMCILAQVYGRMGWASALLDPGVIADVKANIGACPPPDDDEDAERFPCKHVLAEAAARKAARKREEDAREAARMDDAQRAKHELDAKTAEAMAAIAEASKDSNAQTRAVLEQMTALLQQVMAMQAPAKPDKGNGGR